MNRWTDPHPYQNDRQPRDVVGGRLHLPPAGADVTVPCVTCGARVHVTCHGGECRDCANAKVDALMNALRRAQ